MYKLIVCDNCERTNIKDFTERPDRIECPHCGQTKKTEKYKVVQSESTHEEIINVREQYIAEQSEQTGFGDIIDNNEEQEDNEFNGVQDTKLTPAEVIKENIKNAENPTEDNIKQLSKNHPDMNEDMVKKAIQFLKEQGIIFIKQDNQLALA